MMNVAKRLAAHRHAGPPYARGRTVKVHRGPYNPGMNPFAPEPLVRFEGKWTLGDPGAVYEFNVKIQKIESNASDLEWDTEVRFAFEKFVALLQHTYPWIKDVHFTGRSGGWLAIPDPDGRMTARLLKVLCNRVERVLKQFRTRMEREYPR